MNTKNNSDSSVSALAVKYGTTNPLGYLANCKALGIRPMTVSERQMHADIDSDTSEGSDWVRSVMGHD